MFRYDIQLTPMSLMREAVNLLRADPATIPMRDHKLREEAVEAAYNRMVGRLTATLSSELRDRAVFYFTGAGWSSLYEMYYFIIDTNSCDPAWVDPLTPVGNKRRKD